MKQKEVKVDLAIPVKNNMMKNLVMMMKTSNWIFLILLVVLLSSSCAKKIVPAKENSKIEKGQDQISGEQLQNFNYLFMEALKQKLFGNYKNAMKYFLQCEKIKKDDAVEYQISGIFALSGQEDLAVKFGEKAIQHDPGNIWYYYQIASIYQMYDKKDSLLNVYRKIVDRFPDLIKEKVTLGDLYVQNNMPEKAINVYQEVEKKAGKSRSIEEKIIKAYISAGDKEKALEEIGDMIKYFGNGKDIILLKAGVLAQTGGKGEADSLYNVLLKKYGDDPDVQMAAYEQYIKEKDFKKALKILNKIVDNEDITQNKKMDYIFRILYMNNPEINIGSDDIGKVVKKVFENAKDDLRTQLMMVDYYSQIEKYDKAMNILRDMVAKYPMFKPGWQQILYLASTEEENDTVFYYAVKGAKLFKDDPMFNIYLCSYYMTEKNNNKVIQYAEDGITKVLQKGIDYVEKETGLQYKDIIIQLYSYLGEAYQNIKDYKKSDDAFENGLKVDPGNIILLNNYAYFLSVRKEKLKKALKMSKKTITEEPENGTYLDTYGWILFQMGKIKEAGKYLEKALKNGGDASPDILEHYGDILTKMGEKEKAIKYYRKAIEKKGDRKKLEEKIKAESNE